MEQAAPGREHRGQRARRESARMQARHQAARLRAVQRRQSRFAQQGEQAFEVARVVGDGVRRQAAAMDQGVEVGLD
jgi:hypothetical protein